MIEKAALSWSRTFLVRYLLYSPLSLVVDSRKVVVHLDSRHQAETRKLFKRFVRCIIAHSTHVIDSLVEACNKYVSTSKSILRAFISQTSRAKDVKYNAREDAVCGRCMKSQFCFEHFFFHFSWLPIFSSRESDSRCWSRKIELEAPAAPASRTLETIGDLNLFTPNPTTVRASTPQYVTWFIDLDSWVCKADDLE